MSLEGTPASADIPSTDNRPNKVCLTLDEIHLELLAGFSVSDLCLKEFKEHKKDFWKAKFDDSSHYNVFKCLDGHALSFKDRAFVVDKMAEVFGSLRCQKETFYKAVAIMDLYYAKTKV